MSEDRLERALQEMRQEDVDAATVEGARSRAWAKVSEAAAGASCAEFRFDFGPYLSGALAGGRRVLMDDHLGRCPSCRAALAATKGESRVVAMPRRVRLSPRAMRWGSLAAAAALIVFAAYVGRHTIDALMAPGGPRATVVSAAGTLYGLPEGVLAAGAAIGEGEAVRTGPGAHAVLRLADGSLLDVNERTELFDTAAWSGQAVHLQRGDVIVRAAKQRRGHLRVLTRDSVASVKGTVFAVSAGLGGSVVSVVEGSVAVTQPGRDVLLHPGEQAASNDALATTVADAVAWSPDAEEYLELLASVVKIERQLAEHMPRDLRTTSALLSALPAGAVVYGAVPNLGDALGRALGLAEQQSAESRAFGAWWSSETGLELRRIIDRVQAVSALLGDEIAFCAAAPGAGDPVPMVMARVKPGKGAELAGVLDGLLDGTGEAALPYSVADDLMVVTSSRANLAWALGHLGQGAGSPFANAIGERYRRGVGWLMAMDASPLVTMTSGDDVPPAELAGMIGMKYLFLEQRAPAGGEENEVTFAFQGQRAGMGSWLAESGSGGAAEYLPADVLVAGYVSTREPLQLFGEFTALMRKSDASFQDGLAETDAKLGAGFMESFAAAMGTEAAFGLNGFSVNGPAWIVAVLANDPAVIDASLRKLADAFNAELGPEDQGKRIVLGQESAGGRSWGTMKAAGFPFGVTWTYDRGYLVAASDRGLAERAIATRGAGSPLVWSPDFLGQLPSSAGIHPSAFGWVNTKGATGLLKSLPSSPALAGLLEERDPVLVVFNATPDRIHAASRTRLTSLIMNLMLLERVEDGLQIID